MGLDLYIEAKITEKATGRCISACDSSYTESPLPDPEGGRYFCVRWMCGRDAGALSNQNPRSAAGNPADRMHSAKSFRRKSAAGTLPTLTEQGFCGMIYEGNFGTVSVRPHKTYPTFSN